MKSNLFADLMKLALRKKNAKDRISYMFKAIVFLPFLMRDLKKTQRENSSTSLSASGDDVYPLF
jgi:hypothetical protein